MAADGGAGYFGIFVIAWGQTEIDGISPARPGDLAVGSHWCWRGAPIRVDGPPGVLRLRDAAAEAERRQRAARVVRKLLGEALPPPRDLRPGDADTGAERGFEVSDGRRTYALTIVGSGAETLLVASGTLPPRDSDLWVLSVSGEDPPRPEDGGDGVICFVPGTRIATADGPRPIETIRPGDRILTRDDGPQEVLWTGSRRLTGARMHALPGLRPVRIRSGVMGEGQPDGDLVVSPHHRLLVRGPRARLLFGEPEILVAAADLVDGRGIRVETGLREVCYIHLLTERHQVVWANGVETETFLPADADLGRLEAGARAALLDLLPGLDRDPAAYGPAARRCLSAPETAILRHALA